MQFPGGIVSGMKHWGSQIKGIPAIDLQRTILCGSSLCLVINGDVFWYID